MWKLGRFLWKLNFVLVLINFVLYIVAPNSYFLAALIIGLIGMLVSDKCIKLEEYIESLYTER